LPHPLLLRKRPQWRHLVHEPHRGLY
jgi:hypothetical protein